MKYATITICLQLFSYILIGQSPEINWQQVYGGNSEDRMSALVATEDGGFAIAGSSFSNNSVYKSENRIGGYDYWVLKLDSMGTILWENTIGGEQDDILTSLIATVDGGFLLGGYSVSHISGDKTEGTNGFNDYWIVKLSAEGNIEWQQGIGGSDNDRLCCAIQTEDFGYFIGGRSSSSVSGDKTDPSEGGGSDVNDYWVLKLNADGEIEWQETLGGSDQETLHSIAQANDGGYLLGGDSFSDISGDKDADNLTNSYEPWLLKLDSYGAIEWQKTLNTGSGGDPNSIVVRDNGHIIFGISTAAGIAYDKVVASYGGSDFWLVEYTNEGEMVQQYAYGGSGTDVLKKMIIEDDGSILMSGYSLSSISGIKTEANIGVEDYWIVKTDSNMNVLWDKTTGGLGKDLLYDIAVSESGNILLGGYSFSGFGGDKTFESLGLADFWVVSIDSFVASEPCSSAPTGLYADFITATTAKLHWDADPDATKYKIQYRKNTSAVWINTNAVTTFKNLFSLEPSSTYIYRVKAICGAGVTSGWSESASFTTSPLRLGEELNSGTWDIYPNPARQQLTIEVPDISEMGLEFTITNMYGRVVLKDFLHSSQQTVDITNLAAGSYIIRVNNLQPKSLIKL